MQNRRKRAPVKASGRGAGPGLKTHGAPRNGAQGGPHGGSGAPQPLALGGHEISAQRNAAAKALAMNMGVRWRAMLRGESNAEVIDGSRGLRVALGSVIARPQRRPARPQLVGETIELLRSRLGSGEFKIGDRIPSETTLIGTVRDGAHNFARGSPGSRARRIAGRAPGGRDVFRSVKDRGILSGRLRQARVLEVLGSPSERWSWRSPAWPQAVDQITALAAISRAVEGMRSSLGAVGQNLVSRRGSGNIPRPR